ncbi:MAG: hypothetical protein AAGF71_12995 [Pseudomonadota bacterium]
MKSVWLGLSVAAVIGVVAWVVTDEVGVSSEDRFTSPNGSVRLDGSD